jgi:hypothetical protein
MPPSASLLPHLQVDAIADGMIESRLRSPAIELEARALESHHQATCQANHFLFGVRAALVISALLLVATAIAIGWKHGARSCTEP